MIKYLFSGICFANVLFYISFMKNQTQFITLENNHHNGVAILEPPVVQRKLTNREIEVLILICQELSPGVISERLGISDKTFFNHRSSILRKTRAKTNIGIYKFALRSGIIQDVV